MIMTFFVPYRADPLNGGMWVFDNKKIALRYLRTWFGLDLVTSMPWGRVILLATPSGSSGSRSVFQMVRVARVAKLARIVRASRILKRWEDYISMSYAWISLGYFLVGILTLAHWLACLWGVVGQQRSNGLSWHDNLPEPMLEYAASDEQYEHALELYGVALYVALNNIFGGSCEIYPQTWYEYYVQALMMLVGSSVWAYVIGSTCGILATLNPALIEYRQTMDELNEVTRDRETASNELPPPSLPPLSAALIEALR